MMTFTIGINLDNEAFAPNPAPELGRILTRIVADLAAGRNFKDSIMLFDSNGNNVGRATLLTGRARRQADA